MKKSSITSSELREMISSLSHQDFIIKVSLPAEAGNTESISEYQQSTSLSSESVKEESAHA